MKHESKHIDRKVFPPTLASPHGASWEINLDRARAEKGIAGDQDATVAMHVVFAPWAHPCWAYYQIAILHLRRLPGMKAPTIFLPGATHEVFLYALDPETVPDVVDIAELRRLGPINFAGQWIVNERPNPVDLDRAAEAKLRFTVWEIINGHLSPDTDFRREWIKRFSDSNLRR
jgi:hypothetical protein